MVLYFTFYKNKPAYVGASYITVYGRESCGNTKRMVKYLREQSLPFQYLSVDDKKIADQLHSDMRAAGLSTASYYLPVVEVNKKLFINPEAQKIKLIYYNIK